MPFPAPFRSLSANMVPKLHTRLPRQTGLGMLLTFSASNHRSIKEEQTLSLVPTALNDSEAAVFPTQAVTAPSALTVAIVYGANASGKSNLISAMNFMKNAILLSQTQGKPGREIPRRPFALDDQYAAMPSTFEMNFAIDGVRYNYGFAAGSDSFQNEFLYWYPSGRRQVLFERKLDEFNFGRALKGQNRVIATMTRPNALFLSAAAQSDHAQLTKVFNFFQNFEILGTYITSTQFEKEGRPLDPRALNFLQKMGTGVSNFRTVVREKDARISKLNSILREFFSEHYGSNIDIEIEDKEHRLELSHKSVDGKDIFFEPADESAGTRKLIGLLAPVFAAIDQGNCLAIDEIDTSLHTLACEAVIGLFLDRNINKNGAQLIVTTHDTNILKMDKLRRDQVWFVEKESDGSSHLYALSDIRIRKSDNRERGYLQGRFGAVPFSANISDLVAEN